MKSKFAALSFSILLLVGTFTFETPAYSSSNLSVKTSEFAKQPRRKRVKRSAQRFVIHRKSGKARRAICRDGSITFSRNRRGTCSRHGGVRRWLD